MVSAFGHDFYWIMECTTGVSVPKIKGTQQDLGQQDGNEKTH